MQQHIIDPVRKALDYYTEMEKALDREKQNRAPSENVSKSKEAVGAQSSSEVHTDAQGQHSKQDAQWTLGDTTFQTRTVSKDEHCYEINNQTSSPLVPLATVKVGILTLFSWVIDLCFL